MSQKQLEYQARKMADGLCRRCGKLPRLVRLTTGRVSPYCEPCRRKASDRELIRQKLARIAGQAGAPDAVVQAGAPESLSESEQLRDLQLAQRRCAACREEVPGPRLAGGIPFCTDCLPPDDSPTGKLLFGAMETCTCAACGNPLPAAWYTGRIPYCGDCQPQIC